MSGSPITCAEQSDRRCYALVPGVSVEDVETLEAYLPVAQQAGARASETIQSLDGEGYRAEALLAPCRVAVAYAEQITRFVARVRAGLVDPVEIARAAEAIRSMRAR